MTVDSSSSILMICCFSLLCIILLVVIILVVATIVVKANASKEKSVQAEDTTQDPTPAVDVQSPPAKSSFSPGSVGAVSQQVGFDVRELKMMGFTDAEMATFTKEEIAGVVNGKYSLAELRKRKAESS